MLHYHVNYSYPSLFKHCQCYSSGLHWNKIYFSPKLNVIIKEAIIVGVLELSWCIMLNFYIHQCSILIGNADLYTCHNQKLLYMYCNNDYIYITVYKLHVCLLIQLYVLLTLSRLSTCGKFHYHNRVVYHQQANTESSWKL